MMTGANLALQPDTTHIHLTCVSVKNVQKKVVAGDVTKDGGCPSLGSE